MSVRTLRLRASGVLLHPTSLPGIHGNGDLGAGAHRFVDFLASAEQRWWQMLPVGPPGYGDSPYSAESAFAGHPLLVSPESLARAGWLDAARLGPAAPLPSARTDFAAAEAHRMRLLRAAFAAFSAPRNSGASSAGTRPREQDDFAAFCAAEASWLDDFALFRALKREHHGAPWTRWEAGVRRRDPRALDAARGRLAGEIAFEKFVQWAFASEWTSLRAHAAARGVALLGDAPIFVAHDSADVWQNPRDFFLDAAGEPTFVAGVPPDYFSATGQRWGNPLYRWRRMKKSGYAWWIRRLRAALRRFDALRLDHFIGFVRYWRIPATEPTAVAGRWVTGPGEDFFAAVRAALGDLPLVAEDLGVTSRAVKALRDRHRLPGLKVLQFAFGADPQAPDFLPHNYPRRAVVYTGTHDNDTTVGWFYAGGGDGSTRTAEQAEAERRTCLRYLGTEGKEIHWDMVRAALASVAGLALFPMQDLLGLGSEARMNLPGSATGNWAWRFEEGALSPALAERLAGLTRTYGRARGAER
jgi:4-alpha-glucanotransferase